MKTIKKYALLICACVLAISCSENESESLTVNDPNDLPTEVNFIYKGKEYYSKCEIVDDEIFVIDDNVRAVCEKLENVSDIATFVREDGLLEYFDNKQDLYKALNITENVLVGQELMQTKAAVSVVQLELYENTGFGKFMDSYATNSRYNSPSIIKDDKLSSFKLKRTLDNSKNSDNLAYVAFYQLKNYEGSVIAFDCFANDKEVKSLKDYQLRPGSSLNWNDRVSSFRFGIITPLDYVNKNY